MNSRTTVLQVGGLNWATSAAIVEQTLRRRPGVLAVEANVVAQSANVTFDPDRPASPSCPGGSGTAATTAPGSRCLSTCATR